MPCATRVTNSNFSNTCYGNIFSLSKESVRSWSHTSKVTNLKMFAKIFSAVRPKTAPGIRKKIIVIEKRFALYANEISVKLSDVCDVIEKF